MKVIIKRKNQEIAAIKALGERGLLKNGMFYALVRSTKRMGTFTRTEYMTIEGKLVKIRSLSLRDCGNPFDDSKIMTVLNLEEFMNAQELKTEAKPKKRKEVKIVSQKSKDLQSEIDALSGFLR